MLLPVSMCFSTRHWTAFTTVSLSLMTQASLTQMQKHYIYFLPYSVSLWKQSWNSRHNFDYGCCCWVNLAVGMVEGDWGCIHPCVGVSTLGHSWIPSGLLGFPLSIGWFSFILTDECEYHVDLILTSWDVLFTEESKRSPDHLCFLSIFFF